MSASIAAFASSVAISASASEYDPTGALIQANAAPRELSEVEEHLLSYRDRVRRSVGTTWNLNWWPFDGMGTPNVFLSRLGALACWYSTPLVRLRAVSGGTGHRRIARGLPPRM